MTVSTRYSSLTSLLLLGSTLAISGTAGAQSSGSMMVDVGPCIRLESAIQRFACYEQQVENTLTGSTQAFEPLVVPGTASSPTPSAPPAAPAANLPAAPTAPATASAPPAAPPAAAPSPVVTSNNTEANFGLPASREEQDKEIEELHSTITALSETVPNAYMITLENGQVWRQMTPDSTYRLQVGHAVRIYPSRWGSNFRLSAEPLRGFIQVQQVR